eukprot:1441211-Prymnesium_polylepis.2
MGRGQSTPARPIRGASRRLNEPRREPSPSHPPPNAASGPADRPNHPAPLRTWINGATLISRPSPLCRVQMKEKGGHDTVVESDTGDALVNARLVLEAASALWEDATPTGGA